MCCVHTQLWLYGITTTVLTAPDSTGQTFCIHLLNYTHTHKTFLTSLQDVNQQDSEVMQPAGGIISDDLSSLIWSLLDFWQCCN